MSTLTGDGRCESFERSAATLRTSLSRISCERPLWKQRSSSTSETSSTHACVSSNFLFKVACKRLSHLEVSVQTITMHFSFV